MDTAENELSQSARKAAELRQQFIKYLEDIAELLISSNLVGLQDYITNVSKSAETLRQQVFQILVLGDFNRGKSSLLNALMCKDMLPTEVTPCTAILTKIKYGEAGRIVVNFKDGNRKPEKFQSFKEFGKKYSIPNDLRTSSDREEQPCFPEIDQATIFDNHELLNHGVEFIDSPGLSRNEGDNQLTLSYINACPAVLFVLDAGQQLNQKDKMYLDQYLRKYFVGLATDLPKIFFIINLWDLIANRCRFPTEVASAEAKIRSVFEKGLAERLSIGIEDVRRFWGKRLFATSALLELQKLSGKSGQIETGIPQLRRSLGSFLTEDRLRVEIESALMEILLAYSQALSQIQRVYTNLRASAATLKEKVDFANSRMAFMRSLLMELEEMVKSDQISTANEIANDFATYLTNVAKTFQNDFRDPAVEGLIAGKKTMEKYQEDVAHECERVINDRIRHWQVHAGQALVDRLKLLETKFRSKEKKYIETKKEIDKKILEEFESESVDSIMKEGSTTIQPTRISNFGNNWGIDNSFAMANTMGVISGLGAGSLAAGAIAKIAGGAIFGPVGMVVIATTTALAFFQANKTKKNEIKTHVHNKIQQKILAEAEQKKAEVYSLVKDSFEPFVTAITTLEQDFNALREVMESFKNTKQKSETDAVEEEKKLINLHNNVIDLQKKAVQTFESFFETTVTESEIEKMRQRRKGSAKQPGQTTKDTKTTLRQHANISPKQSKWKWWQKVKDIIGL